MEIFDNVTKIVKEDMESEIKEGSRLSIAAACFSIYAYEALKVSLIQLMNSGLYSLLQLL